ncbi:MAG: hypothetical protein NVS4B9_21740 [Ktedonobacteraceae bacterium]
MNTQRLEYIKALFAREGYHALLCRMPQHVLMLTGYQPILGNSFCLVSLNTAREIEMRLAIPADEKDLVPAGTAIEVKTFAEETMDYIGNTLDAAREPLGELLRSARLGAGAIVGIEGGRTPIMPTYTQVGVTGPETHDLLHLLLLGGEFRDATSLLDELSAVKTEEELAAIRRCEAVACQGFAAARKAIHVGVTEADVTAATYAALLRSGYAASGAHHVQPHVHVMAGPRAALAYRAFNLTSNAPIKQGDTVTVQMESGINGYWAELTRTFFTETINEEWRKVYQACIAAQEAALKIIRNGASARDADAAARQVMQQAGLGGAFKHGLGHGFGFQAINHAAAPVLHPASHAILRSGMVHNMEPAAYLDGKGGFRLNDNVAVRENGNEVLSSALPRDLDWLVVKQ